MGVALELPKLLRFFLIFLQSATAEGSVFKFDTQLG